MLIAAFVSIPFLQSGSLLLGNRRDVSQRHKRFPGILSLSYVLLQSLRIVSEAFRPTGNLFSPGSFSSIVALVLQYMTVGFILPLIVMVHQDNLGTLGKREIDLMKNKKILQDFIDFTNDWEYSIHADGRLQYVSPSAERITGYAPEAFVRNPTLLHAILHPEDRERYANHVHEGECRLTYRIVRKDGMERWVEHVCQEVRDDTGDVLGRRVSVRDITARVEGETALQQAKRRADVANQANSDIGKKYGGTGLGLSIVKQYLDLLGGNITV